MLRAPRLIAIAIGAMLPVNAGFGHTITATGVSGPEVQAAVDHARNGDTVLIPSGSAVWTRTVNDDGKGINIYGAGIGRTIIEDATPNNAPGTYGIFFAQKLGGKHFCIAGLTIVGGPKSNYGEIRIGGASYPTQSYSDVNTNFRVTGIQFSNLWRRGVNLTGLSAGVIDHCYFMGVNSSPTGVSITGEGDYGWNTRPYTSGTTDATDYIEDCVFDWRDIQGGANGAIDTYNAARWVFRYNVVSNTNVGDHGTDSGGVERSTHSWEVYSNVFYVDAHQPLRLFQFRGGTGIFYSNVVFNLHPSSAEGIYITDYRCSGTNIYGPPGCCNPWGMCTGKNKYDGNTDQYGYPALDQPGWTSPTVFTATHSVQIKQPVYGWANTWNGRPLKIKVCNIYTNTGAWADVAPANVLIQENRDFFNETVMPGYVALPHPHPLAANIIPPNGL